MNESDVLLRTHAFLRSARLDGMSVTRLFTDSHPTLLPHKQLAPFQRFTLDMGEFVMHPDLVGQLDDGGSIFGLEAKGDSDLLRGVAQAGMYKKGFHYAFLAADRNALGGTLVELARQKNIGIIAVGTRAEIIYAPIAQMPMRDAFQFIARQLDSVHQISPGKTFHYNIPTHYLVWAIALEPNTSYPVNKVLGELAGYPIPKDWRSALSGAQKLGLVRILGDTVELSFVGSAAKDILPQSVSEWAEVHRKVGARGTSVTLVQYQPQSAAILRLLLLQDPLVRLVIAGLGTFPYGSASFDQLAVACDSLDHARAPIFFLKPEAATALMDDRGRIRWPVAEGGHYRSRTFYQYKSILKHAGILAPTPLGGST